MPAGSQKKRVQPRYSLGGRFRGSQLPLHQSHRESREIEGEVKNISDGGFCVIATRAPERSALLQGRLLFPRMQVQIPTLVKFGGLQRLHSAGTIVSVCNSSSESSDSFNFFSVFFDEAVLTVLVRSIGYF